MAAKDYKLCISPLTGTVYISKTSKKHQNVMTNDRVVVDKSDFINAIIQWFEYTNDDKKEMQITENGKVIFSITDHRKN